MHFAKMHGLGNDFIVIENFNEDIIKKNNLAIELCDRHFGIGADGLIFIEKSNVADIKMSIINSDGSIANMCGNGIRCFSKYVYEKNIMKNNFIEVETLAGIMKAQILSENDIVYSVKINMGKAYFDKDLIPFKSELDNKSYNLNINGKDFEITTLLMGVPHTVVFSGEITNEEVIEYGKYIERLPIFPEGTNVDFINIIDRNTISLKTWERGAGFTLACGTGACASAVASNLNNKTSKRLKIKLLKGELIIENINDDIYMGGPASFVFEGEI